MKKKIIFNISEKKNEIIILINWLGRSSDHRRPTRKL